MVRTLIGPELFRAGSDLYFERHDGQAVTIEDFVAAMSEVSGRDFNQFMNWYRQAGTPRLDVRGEYLADKQQYQLHFHQHCPATPEATEAEKQPFLDSAAVGLRLTRRHLPLTTDENRAGQVELTDIDQTILSSTMCLFSQCLRLRGFSVPV
ncbi:MAG: hypothetical protein R3E73_12545 [Porticoccaceae bacterium]